jgi:hypothetical protein
MQLYEQCTQIKHRKIGPSSIDKKSKGGIGIPSFFYENNNEDITH